MNSLKVDNPQAALAGKIGLGVSGVLFLLSSWRLVFHFFIRKRDESSSAQGSSSNENENNSSQTRPYCRPCHQCTPTKWLTRRRTFHFLLWLSQLVEILAYADISGILTLSSDRNFAEKLGYILLDITGRSVLELLAFTTCTGIWLKTAIQSRPTRNLDSRSQDLNVLPGLLFLIITLMLVITSAILSIVLFTSHKGESLQQIQNTQLSRVQLLFEALAWGLHSLVVLQCLIMTGKRIISIVPAAERNKPLMKALLPMLITSLVYALRCGWLVAIYCNASKIQRGTWFWFIFFEWLPVLIVVSTLLYSARKRDQATSTDATSLQQPLLARPPAEAFLAFSQYLNGEEVDDSFCLTSPMGRVFVPAEEDDEEGKVADEETLSTDSFGPNNASQPT